MNKIVYCFAFIVAVIVSGCQNLYKTEPIPAYIHIDKITLSVSDASAAGQGTASSNISDAWIYVDEQLIGCFEMPITVPVLSNGTHSVRIRPGIKVNGIAATRTPYPFYTDFTQTVMLNAGEVATMNPTTTYATNTHFLMIEDFESGNNFQKTASSDTNIQILNAPNPNIFEGNHSAIVYMDNSRADFYADIAMKDSMSMVGTVFLEMNYKCNTEFLVALEGYNTYNPPLEVLTLNPTSTWKKNYLYLSPTMGHQVGSTYFRIHFQMTNSL